MSANNNEEQQICRPCTPPPSPTPTKRPKRCVEDDLICAISLQLPYDPVIAEDGRIYERSAIENHIQSKQNLGLELRSPITQAKMGTKLLPSPQIKNSIETLIETGVITGELAKSWLERDQQKREMDQLINKAKNGCATSMCQVGFRYRLGKNGFSKDYKNAYMWFEKAHCAGCYHATYFIAEHLLHGDGVPKNEQEGIMYLGVAAGKGCDAAAYCLGKALAFGMCGLGINKREAIKWLHLALSGNCCMKQMGPRSKEDAKKLLDELMSGSEPA